MREIQMVDSKEGIAITFADIETLAQQCKFGDCQHQTEPGCAVQQAIDTEELDQRRLNNYLKLLREEAHNSATLSERRSIDKAFGKTIKRVVSEKQEFKGRS